MRSWSNRYPDIYALDFDCFVTDGSYTTSVSGPFAARSPSFKIDPAANLYSTPLANSLYFYENERDGPNYIASPLRTAQAMSMIKAQRSISLPRSTKKTMPAR